MKEWKWTGYGVTTSFKERRQLNRASQKSQKGDSHHQLRAGMVLHGVWNHRAYRIERLLGSGANGVVYLVTLLSAPNDGRGGAIGPFALKISANAVDLQSEVNALGSLEKQRRTSSRISAHQDNRPFLVDVDDADMNGERISFYVMRYVPGESIKAYIRKKGPRWYGIVGSKLLAKLHNVHRHGWVFGDLKAENVIVGNGGEVELVDYGGLTSRGKSVKQFTEMYDRGYWHAGSRTADDGYDLFSFAILTIQVLGGKEFRERMKRALPQTREVKEVLELVHTHPVLRHYESWLVHALKGTFANSEEACRMWDELSRRLHRSGMRPYRPTPLWMKWFFAVSVILFAISIAWWTGIPY
ncbi:serine/threonine protein kinase [Paenibacillaceae sp. P-4]|uniref:protein kinase domain-containing protein n=1 Tax=Paenibacillaceae bacterium P-4 TaxID=3160969 RepID=UPI0032E83987